MLIKVKKQKIIIPINIDLIILKNVNEGSYNFCIKNNKNNDKYIINLPYFLDFKLFNLELEIFIKQNFRMFQASKSMLYTFVSKLKNEIKGISELYRGTINLQGLGYSVNITKLKNNKYSLFFRFGFKDKFTYIIPSTIIIENYETAKTKINLVCNNLELLKKIQIQIQNFRRPKAYKLQGIYLNDIFPKVKKFVK